MDLKNQNLFQTSAFINGDWYSAEDQSVFDVINPFNKKVLANVSDCKASDTQKAIEAAQQALPAWRAKSAAGRSKILKKWFDLQIANVADLAYLLTMEQGKPLAEAKGEIRYGASFVEWFAEEAKRVYGDVIPGHGRDKRITVIKQPIGVVGAITPWNFPSAMVTRKVAPALAAGCTVVLKPSEETPLSALALAALAKEAGFPPGVLNIVPSNHANEVGQVLTTSKVVRKISFTGSTRVGKLLLKQSADSVKKVTLELGGNAPFIVFDDADIDLAAHGAIAAKYRNSGQTCICANRIFVQRSAYDTFLEKFNLELAKLEVGSGLENGVSIGPLINQSAIEKVDRLVQNAVNDGATLVSGGNYVSEKEGFFYQPTVLKDVTAEMEIHHTEIFGPVAPIYVFDTEEEVIQMANNTDYGLAAYFYGTHYARIWRVAEALEYGMIGVNTGMISSAVAPFGGVKESGIGREGSKYGMEDYLETKYICWGGIR